MSTYPRNGKPSSITSPWQTRINFMPSYYVSGYNVLGSQTRDEMDHTYLVGTFTRNSIERFFGCIDAYYPDTGLSANTTGMSEPADAWYADSFLPSVAGLSVSLGNASFSVTSASGSSGRETYTMKLGIQNKRNGFFPSTKIVFTPFDTAPIYGSDVAITGYGFLYALVGSTGALRGSLTLQKGALTLDGDAWGVTIGGGDFTGALVLPVVVAMHRTVTLDVQGHGETFTMPVYYDDFTQIFSEQSRGYSGPVLLPNPAPVDGWRFLGWNTRSDGTGTTVSQITSYPSTDVTYYAQWEEKQSVYVALNANGGYVDPSGIRVYVGDPYGDLPTPRRTGYIHTGWFTAATGGTQVTTTTIVPAPAE